MGYTQGFTRRSRVTPRVSNTPQLPWSRLPSTNHRPGKAWQSTLAKFPWVTPLGLGSLENKCLKSVGYVIERTRVAVVYWGKPKFPHECAARVGNRGWSPIHHRSRVVLSDFLAERKVGSRTQEVQEMNSEG